jgi:hypothetical protein
MSVIAIKCGTAEPITNNLSNVVDSDSGGCEGAWTIQGRKAAADVDERVIDPILQVVKTDNVTGIVDAERNLCIRFWTRFGPCLRWRPLSI